MPRLRVLQGELAGTVCELEPEGNKVGRDPGNHAVLADPSVAPRHARIWFHGGAWHIEPVSSRAYTYINDEPVAAGATASLELGDRLVLGELEVVFEDSQPEPDEQSQALAEASAALDNALAALQKRGQEIAALQEKVRKAEENLHVRDDYLRQRDVKIKELQKSLVDAQAHVSQEMVKAEIERIRAEIEAEAQRQIEAASRRMLDMEKRYVQATTALESAERRIKELDEQVRTLQLRVGGRI